MSELYPGDIIVVYPYCNPNGKVGKVTATNSSFKLYVDDNNLLIEVKYLFGPDKFGRDVIHMDVGDEGYKKVNSMNLELLKALYESENE